ncbi:MAG: NAD(P)H-dependent oxidoreductase, partial [Acetobacter orientalis]|uniref:NAD(P)H-dependent oxidoreductase n=1 Tax=Acetobacter orientalis TaxID=146474 RepID=UPI0039EBAFCD
MNVLIIFAHPERNSLNGALLDIARNELETSGHTVQVSDLYAMKWKTDIDREDFPSFPADERLKVASPSAESFSSHTLTPDVEAE